MLLKLTSQCAWLFLKHLTPVLFLYCSFLLIGLYTETSRSAVLSQYTGPADCRSHCASLDVETRHMLLQCVLLGQNWGVWMLWRWQPRAVAYLQTIIQAMYGFIWPKQYGLQSLFLMQLLSRTSWSSKVTPNKLNFTQWYRTEFLQELEK